MKSVQLFSLLLMSLAMACDRSERDNSPSAGSGTPTARTPASTSAGNPRASEDRSPTRPASSPATTQAASEEAAHSRLYGTWVANDVEASMGDVKIRLTFRKGGPVRILAWSDLPFVGEVRNKEAPYEIHGNTITSDALRGGTSVNYRFDGDDLIIEYKEGKSIRFTRAT